MEIKTLTRRNKKHRIDQLLTTISDQGYNKSPIWLSVTKEDITNREAFSGYDNSKKGLDIIPRADYLPAKQLNVRWTRIPLTDLVYREEPAQIAYSAQLSLKECLWQINELFHTCFHPSESNVEVEIVSTDRIRLSVTDDNHFYFTRSSVILPAVDVSVTLNEMADGTDITLTKEDCVFALNLYGRKTDGRKQESVSWNAYDSLFLAIALRHYQKNGLRDGLNEYSLDDLPAHHHMTIKNGIEYGPSNRTPYQPTESETESANTLTSIAYKPFLDSYPASTKNLVMVHYRRIDIQEYLKEMFKSPTEFDKLRIRKVGVTDRSTDAVVLRAFKEYLNFNLEENITGKSGHVYNTDIIVRRLNGDVVFDFSRHPLLQGEIRVDFGDE